MYNFAKYARSLIREFGRKDEKSVASMWINYLKTNQRDGYLEYFYHLLIRIYCPSLGFHQEYVHEHVCRIFNSYPKLVSNQKYPAFSMDTDSNGLREHLKLLMVEMGKNTSEKEVKLLSQDIEKLRAYLKGANGSLSFKKRIHTIDLNGNVVIRFANLDVPFNYNSCELKEDIAGAAAAAILSWRINNPIIEEKKEPAKLKNSNYKSHYGSYGYDD